MAKRTLRTTDLLSGTVDNDMQEDANMTSEAVEYDDTAQAEQDALDAIANDPDLSESDEPEPVKPSEMGAYLRPDLAQVEQYAKMTPIERIAAKAEARAREQEIHDRIASKVEKPSKRVVEGKVKAEKVAKPKAEPKIKVATECECGCGKLTGGGRFCPGHDATLKSRLIKSARSVNGETKEESMAAWTELERLGWAKLFDAEDTMLMAVMNRKKVAKRLAEQAS